MCFLDFSDVTLPRVALDLDHVEVLVEQLVDGRLVLGLRRSSTCASSRVRTRSASLAVVAVSWR